jgi:hypothetical protein
MWAHGLVSPMACASLHACLDTMRSHRKSQGSGAPDLRHGGSCPHPALSSVGVTAVLDGALQVNVFLACGITAKGMDLLQKILRLEFVALLEVP